MNKIATIALLIVIAHSYSNCAATSTFIGCINCTNPYYKVFNKSEDLYTCLQEQYCATVQLNACIECSAPYVLDNITNSCTEMQGCLQMSNGICLSCAETYTLLSDQCFQLSIPYCISYSYVNSTLTCSICEYDFMLPSYNCSVDDSSSNTLCQVFDESTWKCLTCPENTILHESATYCIPQISNCVYYNTNGCLLCAQKYVLQNGVCLIAGYISTLDSSGNKVDVCLNKNQYYISSSNSCQISSSHCLDVNCTQCINGYYLDATGLCSQCSAATANCLSCSSSTNCLTCSRGYYLLTSLTQTKCMSCTVYGCQECLNIGDNVKCLTCPFNSTLFDGSCYNCSSGSTFSLQDKKCISCTISNCQYCEIIYNTLGTNQNCKWCLRGYFLENSECLALNSSVVVNVNNAYEVLTKAAPGIQTIVYNDQSSLMKICESTNGYVCSCTNVNTTSICSSYDYSVNVSTLFSSDIICEQFRQYSDILRMAAQFPTFDEVLPTNCLMDEYDYWNLLSIYKFEIQRSSSKQSLVRNLYSQLTSYMVNYFSSQKVTIITGNGFYYKYVPQNVNNGNDNYISSTISNSWALYFILYDRVTQSSQLTGKIYVFTDSTSSFSVTVQKNGEIQNSQNFTLQRSGTNVQQTITLSDGYLTIPTVVKSSSTAHNGYQVFSQAQSTVDIYEAERIQFIFWNQSFIYILVFLLLYLIFLPICSIVDCCKTDNNPRRRINTSQDISSQNKNSSEPVPIKINYRDFFPMYNIGNTPRPRRLLKLCLFLLNCQHGVTFLTLAYFNLQADNQIIAVILAIPCYIGTIFMGYLSGFLVKVLPSVTKYLINLITFGYWVLWVILMRIFISYEYKFYVLVFFIIFLVLDLGFDLLQTLLIYFVIKQQDKQVSFFNCLAKWLSYRGFYEFDKLARQLKE